MSFYRTIFTTVITLGLVAPAFADQTTQMTATPPDKGQMMTAPADAGQMTTTKMNAPAAEQSTKLNLNTATAKELMKVKGINASRARAIVAYRKKHGNFKSVDELSSIKGFKKMKADKMQAISSHLSVE